MIVLMSIFTLFLLMFVKSFITHDIKYISNPNTNNQPSWMRLWNMLTTSLQRNRLVWFSDISTIVDYLMPNLYLY